MVMVLLMLRTSARVRASPMARASLRALAKGTVWVSDVYIFTRGQGCGDDSAEGVLCFITLEDAAIGYVR